MFLFCSAYGLASQYVHAKSVLSDVRFILRRLNKFYLNYWVVFIIFVPISIFFFHRPLSVAYGEHVNIIQRLIYDLLGMQGTSSYNITWWFNKLIIIMYLLFPLLYRLVRFKPWLALLGGLALMRLSSHVPYNPVHVCTWLFPFVLGIVWKCYETKGRYLQEFFEKHKSIAVFSSLCILLAMIVLRMYSPLDYDLDGFLSCSIALCVITIIRHLRYTTMALAFLGKHSMNIYMTHTFIYSYWGGGWLYACYWLRKGGNFLICLLICVVISIVLEYIKQEMGLYKLVNRVNDIINRTSKFVQS